MATPPKIEYKPEAPIIIFAFYAILKYDKESEGYHTDLNFDTDYYEIIGDFFYCGLLLFGRLYLTEIELNEIISKINPKLLSIKNDTFYFDTPSDESLNILRKIKLKAKYFGIDNVNPDDEDDDDIDLFLKI